MHRPEWMSRAACLGSDTDLFFPTGNVDVTPEATAVCARCPVRPECLTYAMADPDITGTWAGTSLRERRRLGSARARRAS